jgi:hypothetical protein
MVKSSARALIKKKKVGKGSVAVDRRALLPKMVYNTNCVTSSVTVYCLQALHVCIERPSRDTLESVETRKLLD